MSKTRFSNRAACCRRSSWNCDGVNPEDRPRCSTKPSSTSGGRGIELVLEQVRQAVGLDVVERPPSPMSGMSGSRFIEFGSCGLVNEPRPDLPVVVGVEGLLGGAAEVEHVRVNRLGRRRALDDEQVVPEVDVLRDPSRKRTAAGLVARAGLVLARRPMKIVLL
jgi:hypothetical protein